MTAMDLVKVSLDWRDLVIAGQPKQLDTFLAVVEQTLPPDWKRDIPVEQLAIPRGTSFPSSRCFVRSVGDGKVYLWLTRVSDYRIQGSLIEPSPDLPYQQTIAETICDFRARILEPAAKACGMAISHDRFGPLSLVPIAVQIALWWFYESSPPGWPPTGDAVRRWREFVLAAHQNPVAFDHDEFLAWLEEKGWDRDSANALIKQFFHDVTLLREYEELRETA